MLKGKLTSLPFIFLKNSYLVLLLSEAEDFSLLQILHLFRWFLIGV